MISKDKKILVVYKSKYGSTKKYAEWIADRVNGDLLDGRDITVENLMHYDTIVYGGGIYALGIKGVKVITKNLDRLRDKDIIIFGVGCSKGKEEEIQAVVKHNIGDELKEFIDFFFLRGAFNFAEMDSVDKMMMRLLRMKLKRKKEGLSEEEKELLACYDNPEEWTTKKAIEPIIECINKKSRERISKTIS